MKIAYVSFENPGNHSGVGKKIQTQVEVWRKLGHTVCNFVISNESLPSTSDIQYIGCRYVKHPYLLGASTAFKLHRALSLYKPDTIYCRQMLWWPLLTWSLNVAPLILEINSKDLAEYKHGKKIKYLLHFFTRGYLFKAAAGVVSVTEEIERYLPFHKHKIVIGNGYDFTATIPRLRPHNERPQLIFVGSPGQSWHGVDKIIRLAKFCPEYDFNVVVPGFFADAEQNVKFHGGLYGKELEDLYKKMDVAIGSLALHRNNMSDATPLKTREYLAYGIPVVAGYHDPDLVGCDYFLNIGNFEDNVECGVQQIVSFVELWITKSISLEDVRRRLSHDVKELQRLNFMKLIAT
ncbi:MAG: hypothetical protein AB7U43_00415 [Desulfobacter sp.]